MKRVITLLMMTSLIPAPAALARISKAIHTIPAGTVNGQAAPPAPSPTPDAELDEAKRQADLAEQKKRREVAEQEAAEARRAQLKAKTDAFGDPSKVSVPSGGVTTDESGFVEVQMLALEAARNITGQLTTRLCNRKAVNTLVIYNSNDMAALAMYSSMIKQLQKFKTDFTTKQTEFDAMRRETNPQTSSVENAADFTGLEAIAIPGVATGIIKSVAELINLFRTETEFKNKTVSIPVDMVVSYLVNSITSDEKCATKPAVYFPEFFPPGLFRDQESSRLIQVLAELGPLKSQAAKNVQEIDARIKLIKSIATTIEDRNGKQKEKLKKEQERQTCQKPKCGQLDKEIAELKKAIDGLNGTIIKQTGGNEKGFLSKQEDWVTKLNKLKMLTQFLIDAAEQIISKLNTPDDATKLTAMAQLLRAEQLATILVQPGTFTLRVAVTANGTTKIKKNLFVDAKVRHSAGANLVYQLFDRDGRVVLGNATQFYFDYQSAGDVRALIATPKKIEKPQDPSPEKNAGAARTTVVRASVKPR